MTACDDWPIPGPWSYRHGPAQERSRNRNTRWCRRGSWSTTSAD